jgi:hypothetical protein
MRRMLVIGVIVGLVLAVSAVAIVLRHFTDEYTRPHVYRHVTSPDGSWSATVLRQRVSPYLEGVDVIVRIEDQDGQTLHEARIDNRDLWEDVDERYPEVLIDNDRLRLGPKYWDGQREGYYELRRRDLTMNRP